MDTGGGDSSRIRAIDQADVHRITSAQVVLDLHTAVKEVIENALDAGATSIEVRFKEYGTESFEVIDNGSGIDSKDYDAIALKHHTSKLSTFAELQEVQTFGFRGEALSSLCALASVTMHTATEMEAPVGTLLKFDKNGKVTPGTRKQPRQRGTTVTICDLFKGFPVRRREFEKNVKREYAKAQGVLQAYALIQKGVRWMVYNTPKQGGRKTIQMTMSANSSPTFLLNNVTDLFGAKVATTLDTLHLNLELPRQRLTRSKQRRTRDHTAVEGQQQQPSSDPETISEDEDDSSQARHIEVVGAMSKLLPACGRTSADRQFFYINGRPWEPTKFARIFNDVYRSNNIDRYPMIIADFRLPTASYDVNITPDKRTIFLHFESALQDSLKSALEAFVSRYHGVFNVNTSTQSAATQQSRLPTSWTKPRASDKAEIPSSSQADVTTSASDDAGDAVDDNVDAGQILSARKNGIERDNDSDDQIGGPSLKKPRLSEPKVATSSITSSPTAAHPVPGPHVYGTGAPRNDFHETEDVQIIRSTRFNSSQDREAEDVGADGTSDEDDVVMSQSLAPDVFARDLQPKTDVLSQAATPSLSASDASTLGIDIGWLQQRSITAYHSRTSSGASDETTAQGFSHAGVGQSAHEAEEQLQRVITKSDFARMGVVGQFNLGFIIARRRTQSSALADEPEDVEREDGGDTVHEQHGWMDDLFIVDQHASDEKYNFERLQAETVIKSQRLIQPRKLELPVSDELVAVEHLGTLKKNGFELEVEEEERPGSRLKLTAQPISKSVSFGPKDLAELLHLLRNLTPGSAQAQGMRCSKTRTMFASRACRSSVMVGKALTGRQMHIILNHMGTIDQPWNCPHGRPTMRHLVSITEASREKGMAEEDEIQWASLKG
ncbi:unnamed protein product [Tilletia controversa]|uniref:DNA mismatch repair protein PMS1 n=1 Tax=Tilletia controversa TaxID=13291 RepID=A0A8X7MQ65_9BASI|nr:hypothetical protein CF328_g4772 [Tilletia controversa]KAE8245555.1 hypothetical protein A4X06_0g5602 [Tilletia controversa]CAD6911816.1 unnamed protein product [Tilletia controversa]CAD6918956.1 unnamed protein product [Tilletia controversa]CAD6958218.1 unnamed protein product [Tilletia controversa]